jgi:acetylornithine deacetylase/succinyl-diaminopimelate desuccinylase-like protein
VLRPYTAFKLSLRLPPLVDGNEAAVKLKALLEDNAPYNAKVTFVADGRGGAEPGTGPGSGSFGATGWNAPSIAPWLERALNEASLAHYGAPVGYIGQGGTIPLMSLLQRGFPAAQMMVCGVLGPKSNAHGPNEFLYVPYGKRLTAAVAQVMAACP